MNKKGLIFPMYCSMTKHTHKKIFRFKIFSVLYGKESNWSNNMCFRYRTLFPYKPDPRPTFLRHTQRSRIQKLGLFRGPQKILRASEAGKKK